MKKLLLATSALALVGSGAYAEISISGTAELGIDYNSEADVTTAKHTFVHEVGIDFAVSGTTDGGLSFGGSAGFDTNDDVVNLGTVHVGGAFGKITIGDNDAADLASGGIADVGLNGIGVDDVAEDLRGTTAASIRYDNSFGQVSFAISAGSADGTPEMAGSPAEAAVPARVGHYGYTLGVAAGIRKADDVFVATQSGEYTMSGPSQWWAFFGTNPDIDGLKTDENGKVIDTTASDAEVTETDRLAAYASYTKWFNVVGDAGVDAANASNGDDTTKPVEADITYLAADPGKDAVKAGAPTPATGPDNQYAFGMKFDVGNGMSLGVGYDSGEAVNLAVGYSIANLSGNLFYATSEGDVQKSAIGGEDFTTKHTGMGMDMVYAMGASKMTLVFSQMSIDNLAEYNDDGQKLVSGSVNSYGINLTHDLGGGASVVAGFGSVPNSVMGSVTADNELDTSTANKASIGLSFTF